MNNRLLNFFWRVVTEHAIKQRGARFVSMSSLTATVLITAFLLTGPDVSPQVGGSKQNYPVMIKDSADQRAKAEREWRRMLDSYGVAQTPPDLYPITNTPRSLLGVSGAIQLLAAKPEPGTESFALRVAMKLFIDRWRDLLAADPATISLVSDDESGDTSRLRYRQGNYAYPVAGNFGEMIAVVSRDGKLMQLDDRFIPVVDLPLKPKTERDVAAKKVVGKVFSYTDVAGREQRLEISAASEVTVKRLVILPIQKGDAVEVHLAWEIVAGKSMSWTMYLDAITGDELKVAQNFQT
jgi:hypothetical protein